MSQSNERVPLYKMPTTFTEVFQDIWRCFKNDKELRIIHLWFLLMTPVSHWLIQATEPASNMQHIVLGAFQIILGLMLMGLAIKEDLVQAQRSLIKSHEGLKKAFEDRHIKYEAYVKHLEETNNALRGNPEVHADGVTQ